MSDKVATAQHLVETVARRFSRMFDPSALPSRVSGRVQSAWRGETGRVTLSASRCSGLRCRERTAMRNTPPIIENGREGSFRAEVLQLLSQLAEQQEGFGKQQREMSERLNDALSRLQQGCLTIAEAAEYIGVSRKHIRRLVQQCKLPCSDVRTEGAKKAALRITKHHIDAFLENCRPRQTTSKKERDALVEKYFGKPRKRQSSVA